jgi:hypothetical protein
MNKRLYSIYLIDGCDNKRIESNTKVVTPHIFINALEGTASFHTLKVTGKVDKHLIFIMVDSRSTQNFINSRIFYRLQCSLVTIRPLLVKAANKGTIFAQQCARILNGEYKIIHPSTTLLHHLWS